MLTFRKVLSSLVGAVELGDNTSIIVSTEAGCLEPCLVIAGADSNRLEVISSRPSSAPNRGDGETSGVLPCNFTVKHTTPSKQNVMHMYDKGHSLGTSTVVSKWPARQRSSSSQFQPIMSSQIFRAPSRGKYLTKFSRMETVESFAPVNS